MWIVLAFKGQKGPTCLELDPGITLIYTQQTVERQFYVSGTALSSTQKGNGHFRFTSSRYKRKLIL